MGYRTNFQGLVVTILFVLLISCSQYTAQEKKEYQHFKKGQVLFLEAGRYLKKITSDTKGTGIEVGSFTIDEKNKYIQMLLDVEAESRQISDDILSKIHPKLPEAYKTIFIPCIENKLKGFRDYDVTASIRGSNLHNDWIDWWNANYREFKTF